MIISVSIYRSLKLLQLHQSYITLMLRGIEIINYNRSHIIRIFNSQLCKIMKLRKMIGTRQIFLQLECIHHFSAMQCQVQSIIIRCDEVFSLKLCSIFFLLSSICNDFVLLKSITKNILSNVDFSSSRLFGIIKFPFSSVR